MTKPMPNPLPALVQKFFAQHLINERQLSPCTVASYRDTFRLLLSYLQGQIRQNPAQQRFQDWDAPHILGFLEHLEKQRHCCARSRNTRLAAIHCFMRFPLNLVGDEVTSLLSTAKKIRVSLPRLLPVGSWSQCAVKKPSRLPMNRSSARCSRARPRPRIHPCAKRSSTRTRDEDELAWQVHGPDARPMLEVETFHDRQNSRHSNNIMTAVKIERIAKDRMQEFSGSLRVIFELHSSASRSKPCFQATNPYHESMKVTEILETCIYVEDLARAEEFYRGVLGLEVIARQEGRHAFFRCGNRMFLVFNPAKTLEAGAEFPPHGARGPSHAAFGVRVDELPAWREYLAKSGVAIENEVTWPNGGRSLYFRDPAGNSLELATPRIWSIAEEAFFGQARA